MEKFQCFECGLNSVNQKEIIVHMNTHHNIKVEDKSDMKTYFCGSCSFKSLNMNEFKKHMMDEHKKEEHDWWSDDIKAKYYCNQCDIEFDSRDMFTDHRDLAHDCDSDRIEEEIIDSSEQVKSEYYEMNNYPETKNESDDEEIEKAYGKKKEYEQMGVIMKGKSQKF